MQKKDEIKDFNKEIQELKKDFEELKQESECKEVKIQEYETHLKRLQADFENYQKRVDREKQDISNYSNEKIILKVLEAIDNFELTLKHIDNASKEDIVKGIQMTVKQLSNALESEGLKELEAKEKFDPFENEAIERLGEGDNISEVIQKGYSLKGKIIRPIKVKIGGKNE
ncbi:nucleotide exchange factor GrpE [Candidatus Woesearchaeota archaeon]|nr:nucleotide exchange factor GrpE [Candidatus Woesearchaeota archaeon]